VSMRQADRLLGLVGLLGGGVYAYVAAGIPKSMLSDEVGPGGVPFWVGILVIAISALLLLKSWIGGSEQEQGTEMTLELPADWRPVVGLLVVLVAYVLTVDVLGYLLAIALLIGSTALLAGHVHSRQLYLLSVGSAMGLYLVFEKLMNIKLQKGVMSLLGL
jgi:putative tricarboxylic transport membrane protein